MYRQLARILGKSPSFLLDKRIVKSMFLRLSVSL